MKQAHDRKVCAQDVWLVTRNANKVQATISLAVKDIYLKKLCFILLDPLSDGTRAFDRLG